MHPAHRLARASLPLLLAAVPAAAQRSAPSTGTSGAGAFEEPGRVPILNRATGVVWLDEDRDGVQDPGEPGVGGVLVKLLDAYGRQIGNRSTLTDAQGAWTMEGMDDGEYRVAFVRPDGMRFTRSDVGSPLPGGGRFGADARPDDSDLNLENGWTDPARRGPHETGMRYVELTRVDGLQRPWPINLWMVYPAAAGSSAAPKARVRELYLDDLADMANNVATSKLATGSTGGNPADVTAADPDGVLQDIEARIDAPASSDGPFPVVILFSGLLGSAADMVEIGDWLASHGYVALCTESTAFHASVALGGRLTANGGIYEQADFDHVPHVGAADLATLVGYGYQPDGYITGNWTGSLNSHSNVLLNDSTYTLNRALNWNVEPGHPLEGCMDLGRVGWYGYSAGASRSALSVNNNARIDLLINCDSSSFVNVPKPMLWVGNHSSASTLGPSIQARLSSDFHPHYFFIPAIRFDPPAAANLYHREYHHDFRNAMITAFCGHWLKDVLAYREDLGLEGVNPRFDGYVTPYLKANVPGWHAEAFRVAQGSTQEIDAGLVDVRLWVLDGNRLVSVATDFLPAGTVAGAAKTAHGPVQVLHGGQLVALGDRARGLAIDAEGRAWLLAGAAPELYELDLPAILGGAAPVAQALGAVAGLPRGVQALAWEPGGARLLAVSGGGTPRLWAFPAEPAPVARDLGALPLGISAPAGLDLDARGRLWVSDAAADTLTRVDAGTGQELDVEGVAGLHGGRIAYDDVAELSFVVDATTGELFSVDPENGAASSHGSLVALGIGPVNGLALERRRRTAHVPSLEADVAALGAGPQPLLTGVAIDEPAGGWNGWLLRVQIGEGTGLRSDVLTVDGSGPVTLGARQEVDLPTLLIGEAREILWNGTRVAWLETDWDLATGGTRLAPLRIAFTASASAPAVAAVVEALRYTGPLPRRFTLDLTDPTGHRGLAEVLELAP